MLRTHQQNRSLSVATLRYYKQGQLKIESQFPLFPRLTVYSAWVLAVKVETFSVFKHLACFLVPSLQGTVFDLELWNLVTMLDRSILKNGFLEFSKKLFWGKFGGEIFWILAESKNSFFHRIENHIIKNIQIGHFSLKPLIIPFGEFGGTGGVKSWKFTKLKSRFFKW